MLLRGLLGCAVTIAAAGSLAGSAAAAEKFTFLSSWFAQAEHGGFYQAKATGLYEKAGIDIDLRMGGPQVNGIQLLLAGEVDAIMGYDFQVLQSVEKGLPAITVAASFQYDLQGMMTHDDVKSLGGLKDKTILVASAGRTSWWPWLKAKYGYTDEQTKPYTFNLQPFFADPNTAQQSYPSSEPFQALEKGVPVNFFLFATDGYPPYGTTIVTTQKVLAEKREVLRRFVHASMQGWKDYIHNPAPGNALIKVDNPKMSDAQIAFGIAKLKELKILDAGGKVAIGSMTDEHWEKAYAYLVSAGLLKPETDWHKAYTLEFVKDLTQKLD
jgi:NitT/TauT family transport system substrate-binding protein